VGIPKLGRGGGEKRAVVAREDMARLPGEKGHINSLSNYLLLKYSKRLRSLAIN
jgi:hypothetical protein